MVKYCLYLFIIFPFCAFSQVNYEKFKGELVNTITPTRLIDPYFCVYKDSNYAPIRLKYIESFNYYSTPENLILSAYCGTYTDLTKVPVYNGPKPDTTNKNGLILIHKLTFFWQGIETSIVKVSEMKDSLTGKPITVQLQKINDSWTFSEIKEIDYIVNVISSVRTDMFWEIYTKADSTSPYINNTKKNVKDEEGFLNISLLSTFIDEERKNNPAGYNLICDN